MESTSRPRLAIIGCGSSGLITLKSALDELPEWEIVCFEKSDQIIGVWGNPYPGFVSTSTRYTTQFACFPERDASIEIDHGKSRTEFFRNAEYGEYLTRFADAFHLHPHIKLRHQVKRLTRDKNDSGWLLTVQADSQSTESVETCERFDAVVICTGLTAQIKPIESKTPTLSLRDVNTAVGIASIRNERIVIFGGGELGVDFATRLSQPELGNQVYLSLRTGVRVSPRYHPIHGVPSDFLRNRLMLSVHPILRNWIGQRFVESRILHQERFEKWFPATTSKNAEESQSESDTQALLKEWAYKLTKTAKDDLFNMFHNKSDDFLEYVAKGQVKIIGPPVDASMESFYEFQSEETISVQPTKIVPAIGFQSTIRAITEEPLIVTDFYLGCCHVKYSDLYLVGFARPIIGNIPSISEMQAGYICRLISGRCLRPKQIGELNAQYQRENAMRFSKLDLETIYPVEMFPYCDRLARHMGWYPSLRNVGGIISWWKMQLTPATTMHYRYDDPRIRQFCEQAPVYMPLLFILLLLILKPFDWTFRMCRFLLGRS